MKSNLVCLAKKMIINALDYDAGLSSHTDSSPFLERGQDELVQNWKRLLSLDVKTNTSSETDENEDFINRQYSILKESGKHAIEKLDIGSFLIKKEPLLNTSSPSICETKSPSVSELVSFIKNHLKTPYALSMANRLDTLIEACFDEAPEQAPISPNSLAGFIDFIQSTANLAEPEIVFSPAGNICAEWHKSRKEHFALEFLPTGHVRYVVFAPDPKHPSTTDRASGIVYADSLMEKVKPFNVLSWITS